MPASLNELLSSKLGQLHQEKKFQPGFHGPDLKTKISVRLQKLGSLDNLNQWEGQTLMVNFVWNATDKAFSKLPILRDNYPACIEAFLCFSEWEAMTAPDKHQGRGWKYAEGHFEDTA